MSDTKPIDTIRLGALNAAIWKNDAADKPPWYNVTLERRYRDQQSGEWKSTQTFGRDDMLPLAKLLDMTHTRIMGLQADDREATQQAAQHAGKKTAEKARSS
ncbi:MAG: hypothetical protein AAFY46_16630 [Planctomycetota bacterium]